MLLAQRRFALLIASRSGVQRPLLPPLGCPTFASREEGVEVKLFSGARLCEHQLQMLLLVLAEAEKAPLTCPIERELRDAQQATTSQ